MSDTYFIKNLRCAYCGENNDFEKDAMRYGHAGLPYTSEFGGEFVCDKCKKKNDVVMNFVAVTSQSHELRVPVGPVEGFEARANLSQIRVIDTRRLEAKVGFLEMSMFSNLRKAARDISLAAFQTFSPLRGQGRSQLSSNRI